MLHSFGTVFSNHHYAYAYSSHGVFLSSNEAQKKSVLQIIKYPMLRQELNANHNVHGFLVQARAGKILLIDNEMKMTHLGHHFWRNLNRFQILK